MCISSLQHCSTQSKSKSTSWFSEGRTPVLPAAWLTAEKDCLAVDSISGLWYLSAISKIHSSAVKETRQIILATSMARWKKRVSLRFFGHLVGPCSESELLCYTLWLKTTGPYILVMLINILLNIHMKWLSIYCNFLRIIQIETDFQRLRRTRKERKSYNFHLTIETSEGRNIIFYGQGALSRLKKQACG